MTSSSPVAALLLLVLAGVAASSLIRVDDDGAYSRVTVSIARQVPRQHCKAIMTNLKVREKINMYEYISLKSFWLHDASSALIRHVTHES